MALLRDYTAVSYLLSFYRFAESLTKTFTFRKDCDEKFRNCLAALNTEIANTLGAAFFNTIQVTCFSQTTCSPLQR